LSEVETEFKERGYFVLKNVISAEELHTLQVETLELINKKLEGEDFWYNDDIPANWYNKGPSQGNNEIKQPQSQKQNHVPFRIEYPIDKLHSCKVLIGQYDILQAIECIQGHNFVPTWDSLVFKVPGAGVPIKWHRDAEATRYVHPAIPPPIDVGIYLDDATVAAGTCLWVIPGSHKWEDPLAASMIQFMTSEGFRTAGAYPVEVGAGDAVFHDIRILHGSPATQGTAPLRRTVYFEFRPADLELKMGPHIPEYIPLKQQMLGACVAQRRVEYPLDPVFDYRPHPNYAVDHNNNNNNNNNTYRFPHQNYFQ